MWNYAYKYVILCFKKCTKLYQTTITKKVFKIDFYRDLSDNYAVLGL
jgi:transcription elongation factor Elf1